MSPSDAAKRFRETADTYLDMAKYVSDERRRRILHDLFEENEAKAELLERVLSSQFAFQQAFAMTND
jgi:hypothetical protein